MRKFTNNEISEIRRNLNGGVVYVGVKNGKATGGKIYHSSYPSKFIAWEHYGQSAIKNTNEQLRWLLETIFANCDDIVIGVWSDYHISYIPLDKSYEAIDYSTSHPNVLGVYEVEMKDTIKAKNGYIVKQRKSDPTQVRVYDGEDFLFEGERRSYEDYVEEVVNEGNEAARKCEVFTTTKGNQFVYWRDEEADWDLITKIN